MTKPDAGREGEVAPEVQVLQAREVSVPIGAVRPSPSFSPELLKLRSDFLAGEVLSADDLRRVMVATAEDTAPSNGNCNIC